MRERGKCIFRFIGVSVFTERVARQRPRRNEGQKNIARMPGLYAIVAQHYV